MSQIVDTEDAFQLSAADLSREDRIIYITDSWKFNAGDNKKWAAPAYDDSSWQHVSTYLGPSELPFIEWNGIGWFRMHLKVDSSLVDFPLALLIEQHNGASEIYLDGKLLYELGEVSAFEESYKPYRDNRPRPIVLSDTATHVIAVRFANHAARSFNEYGFTAGFRFLIGDLDYHVASSIGGATSTTWSKVLYTGILLAFTVIHMLLFAFYPSGKQNLFFALFTAFLALLTFTILQTNYSDSPLLAISYYRVSLIAWLFTIVYALRFCYSLFYDNPPKVFWIFGVIGLGLAIGTWFDARNLDVYRELFAFLGLMEIIRVLMISFYKQKEGVWIIGSGLMCLVAGILFTVLANLDVISGDPVLGNLYGSAGLIFGMSIYLSRDFAQTNKRLKYKLEEVKHLSERALEQERINKQKEIEHELLTAENERKSKELEEARALQLSMLPKKVPESSYWDIAVFMETAHEVGGDYYDFVQKGEDVLTVAVGDATGHGMKAGIMVATAKSYFHTLANNYDTVEMLQRMSSGIRNMNLRMMFMSMLFLKCKQHSIEYTSAGMPPVLHYQNQQGTVRQVLLKGMPLGARVEFPYQKLELSVQPGDSLLLMSDGLMELFNKEREQLGLERIEQVFKDIGDGSASDIISEIMRLAEKWAGGNIQEDDITLVALKAKTK
ncbi:PP2C family protein-serine/threonine phosphatase [Gracilimonas mengyeensis]|uniref:Serine phosphatase RsbU, regulator of sigma subunit n=1 Tax=Gracilimonas mengyeensis TaxID=1302730 RepID=A0A521EB13_9BACT|nr:SpoIIE family protein phosphatase [Gracilimonas mengyeensis]SMO80651.1 Serine phosphatase RsbU, regulator of sigma subunit [Gracilimonas mengyeensis]